MKILLVGNYAPDRQESMLRFAACLKRELPKQGVAAELLCPPVRVGRSTPRGGLAKWLGYLDKFVFFPSQLRRAVVRSGEDTLVHICDHSNALYTRCAPAARVLVTCHDLLAVRGALGEDTDCPATATGKILQRKILTGLKRAGLVACVSTATQRDFQRLTGGARPSQVVLNGLNHGFQKLVPPETDRRLSPWPELNTAPPFLLHVGSGLRRKNREGILRILASLKARWPGLLVIAGEGLSPEQTALARELGVAERVREIRRPSDEVLEALYNRAHALIFPSRFEGFGWPILEAQACGCPVITADTTSLPEVAGDGAVVLPVADEPAFADAVLELTEPRARAGLIERGFANIQRFTTERMIADYVNIYRQMLGSK